MFDVRELRVLISALETQADYLKGMERFGVPTVRARAELAAVLSKSVDLAEGAAKLEAKKDEAKP